MIVNDNFNVAAKVLADFSTKENFDKINAAAALMIEAVRKNKKMISCGNGGSMCDAMHFAEEMTGRFQKNRPPLPAIAISDSSHITCVTNDYGYEHIFSRSIEALGQEGDVLLAISTSGNSQNVISAIESAMKKKIKVIALTGKDGGKVSSMADIEIRVAYNGYADRIQEIHIKIIHSLIQLIEQEIYPQYCK